MALMGSPCRPTSAPWKVLTLLLAVTTATAALMRGDSAVPLAGASMGARHHPGRRMRSRPRPEVVGWWVGDIDDDALVKLEQLDWGGVHDRAPTVRADRGE